MNTYTLTHNTHNTHTHTQHIYFRVRNANKLF